MSQEERKMLEGDKPLKSPKPVENNAKEEQLEKFKVNDKGTKAEPGASLTSSDPGLDLCQSG